MYTSDVFFLPLDGPPLAAADVRRPPRLRGRREDFRKFFTRFT